MASKDAILQALVIVLPSQLARYDDQLGFVVLDGQLAVEPNDYQSTLVSGSTADYKYRGSRQTSYQDHIRGLIQAYNAGIKDEIAYVAHRLEKQMGLSNGIVDQAVRLAIACHDLGKLDQAWQQWALSWQKLLWERQGWHEYQVSDPSYCYAKTDHDYSKKQKEWQRDVKPKRPPHACESVAIGRNLIGTSLGITKTERKECIPVLRAVCGAIARHHTSQASEHGLVTLNENARNAAEEALKISQQGAQWSYNTSLLCVRIPHGDNLAPSTASSPKLTRPEWERDHLGELETWLYFVIVRALRLADQRAG